jgi:hypothetical protein
LKFDLPKLLAAKPRFALNEVALKRAEEVPSLELPISDTLPNRDARLAVESPKVRLAEVRELENAEFENDVPRADDPPNCRLSKFDIAREPEIADPVARDEFIAIELFALREPAMPLEEFEGLPSDPRDSPPDLADIEEPELPPPKFRAAAELPDLAEFGELPNPCH